MKRVRAVHRTKSAHAQTGSVADKRGDDGVTVDMNGVKVSSAPASGPGSQSSSPLGPAIKPSREHAMNALTSVAAAMLVSMQPPRNAPLAWRLPALASAITGLLAGPKHRAGLSCWAPSTARRRRRISFRFHANSIHEQKGPDRQGKFPKTQSFVTPGNRA